QTENAEQGDVHIEKGKNGQRADRPHQHKHDAVQVVRKAEQAVSRFVHFIYCVAAVASRVPREPEREHAGEEVLRVRTLRAESAALFNNATRPMEQPAKHLDTEQGENEREKIPDIRVGDTCRLDLVEKTPEYERC